jgi:hypothetical protein
MNNLTNVKTCVVMSVIVVALLCATAAADVIYVDDDASPGGDGLSWPTAYNYLQDALVAAQYGEQIWVAGGTYYPSQPTDPCDQRTATFQLINGVAIYGGFAGTEDPCTFDLADRDFVTNETILSGDLDYNDIDIANPEDLLDEPTRAENSYHVVTGSGTDPNTILDGFTISAGNDNHRLPPIIVDPNGGDIIIDPNGNIIIDHVNITAGNDKSFGRVCMCSGSFEPTGLSFGGGMFNNGGNLTVTNCTFSGNSAGKGGGMYNSSGSNSTVTNCTFSGNLGGGDGGGGMYNSESSPMVVNCTFSGNSAGFDGGGMLNDANSIPMVTNCTFSGNSAGFDGGGMYNGGGIVGGCTFNGNSACGGGGMYNGSGTVEDSSFSGNLADCSGGGISNSTGVITDCSFINNSADYSGGGMYNSSGTVMGCMFAGNLTYEFGGGMFSDGNPMIMNCTFIDNRAVGAGGGVFNVGSKPIMTNCIFLGNLADYSGGGMYNVDASSPMVVNCAFSGNEASTGGGMFNSGGEPNIINCTFVENSAEVGGGLLNFGSGSSGPTVTNCILWGNTDSNPPDESAQIHGGPFVINYSCLQGWTGSFGGIGNIGSNPLFIDIDGADNVIGTEDDNFRLSTSSPCIDSGDNSVIPMGVTTDLYGGQRISGDYIDRGVYEHQYNRPPVAEAGSNQTAFTWINGVAEVALDGSGSSDPDGDELTYTWFLDADEIATSVNPTIELLVGEHTIELIVNDGTEDSEPDEVVITVIEPIEADVHIVPKVINRNNHLKRVIAIMHLPEGIGKDDVVRESFELYAGGLDGEPIGAILERVIGRGNMTRVFALFDKDELMDAVHNNGRKELTVVGKLESGQYILGSDTVRILQPRRQRRGWLRRRQ